MATRWAICGGGNIANDFCACLKGLPASEHQIVAVASNSSKAKAEEFAKKFDIPKIYDSYDELMKDDDIDVVYVGTIHPYHVETCLKAINAGKNVLCEKPMALSLEGCKKVLAAAKEKGVLFVEAFWSRFFPAYNFIKEQINAGVLGDIKVMESSFCLPISEEVKRMKDKSRGAGAIMDFGCYVVQAANFVFSEKPDKIWSDGILNEEGVDKAAVIHLSYSGGRFAHLMYSTETQPGNNNMFIRGTKGTIVVQDYFWSPTQVFLNGELKEFPLPQLEHKVNFWNSEGLTYEAQGVRECLLNGWKESPNITHADSENIMTVLQQVLDNFGIKYDAP